MRATTIVLACSAFLTSIAAFEQNVQVDFKDLPKGYRKQVEENLKLAVAQINEPALTKAYKARDKEHVMYEEREAISGPLYTFSFWDDKVYCALAYKLINGKMMFENQLPLCMDKAEFWRSIFTWEPQY